MQYRTSTSMKKNKCLRYLAVCLALGHTRKTAISHFGMSPIYRHRCDQTESAQRQFADAALKWRVRVFATTRTKSRKNQQTDKHPNEKEVVPFVMFAME